MQSSLVQPKRIQPQIIVRPGFTIVGMKYHGNNQHGEISQLWRKFGPRMHEIRHATNRAVSYGLVEHFDESTGEFDYIAGMEVDSTEDIAEDMMAQRVPPQTYAIFPTTLPALHQTFDTITSEWLPNSGYRHADGPELELYDEHFDPADPASEMYVYIPIVANA